MLHSNKAQWIQDDPETTAVNKKTKIVQLNDYQPKRQRTNFLYRMSKNSLTSKDYVTIASSFVLMIVSATFLFIFQNEINLWHELRLNTWWGKPMYALALTLLLIKKYPF